MTEVIRDVDAWGRTTLRKAEDGMALLYAGMDILGVGFPANDPETLRFNTWAKKFSKPEHLGPLPEPSISPEEEHALRAADWLVPMTLRDVDIREYLLSLCVRDDERARVHEEMDLYEQLGATDLLRIAIMLVTHFRENNIVWGVGRGSSVASYALFLIGMHKIDSIKYGLPISEFLR